jgi:hypothetical protein
MVWITRTDKPLSDPTGLSSKEAVSTVLDTRVIPSGVPLRFHRTHRWTIQHCFARPLRCFRLRCGSECVFGHESCRSWCVFEVEQ